MASPIKHSKKVAYAKGYFTGKDHYRQLKDSSKITVRGSAKRGYRRGLHDAHFEYKQRQQIKRGD